MTIAMIIPASTNTTIAACNQSQLGDIAPSLSVSYELAAGEHR
ncbi:MAG: hypothetical protein ABSC56_04815 [Solirubrobacteraceae bacterium]